MNKIFLIAGACVCFTSCTYNVSMAHTSGTASDVIDDAATASPDVSPSLTIPVSATGTPLVTK